MSDKLSVIIPTGARPEAFALCLHWLEAQSLHPDEVIIIDDGEEATTDSIDREKLTSGELIVITPEVKWKLGDNTQKRNMLIGLTLCTGDLVAILEDDDYYAPTYLEVMVKELTNPRYQLEVVGALNSRYYNLPNRKYKLLNNKSFAPLAQTIFKKSAIPTLSKVLKGRDTKFDVYFWKELTIPRYLLPETTLTVGMKGMPGRPGLGIGHNAEAPDWQQDTENLNMLEKWIGEDVKYYRELIL